MSSRNDTFLSYIPVYNGGLYSLEITGRLYPDRLAKHDLWPRDQRSSTTYYTVWYIYRRYFLCVHMIGLNQRAHETNQHGRHVSLQVSYLTVSSCHRLHGNSLSPIRFPSLQSLWRVTPATVQLLTPSTWATTIWPTTTTQAVSHQIMIRYTTRHSLTSPR